VYGLTKFDLKLVREKIVKQKDFLEDVSFTTPSGQTKTLLDVSFSANHSVRYYAQLSNKIDTISKHALIARLHSYFLTITLDGIFRDFIKGDYRRFDLLSDDDRIKLLKSVPDNEINGYIRSLIISRSVLSVRDLYNVLIFQTKNFFKSYAFKKLKKSGKQYMFVRTVEPHKDGVPHFHMMLWIPEEFSEVFKRSFIASYPAPRNAVLKKDLYAKEKIKFQDLKDDDMIAFQTNIKDSTAYIMKYIIKTFRNVQKNDDMDYLQAWYVKHRIMRCVTSRSVVPQWVYKLAYPFESDWFHLTDHLKDPTNFCEWSKEDNYFYFNETRTGRELIYTHGVLEVVYGDIVVKRLGEVKLKNSRSKYYDKIPKKWKSSLALPAKVYNNDDLIGLYKNNQFTFFRNNVPDYMKDYQLLNYFNNLDLDTCNLQHFGYVKNCMIKRGLYLGDLVSLNYFNFSIF
jgi:hypothetical protein